MHFAEVVTESNEAFGRGLFLVIAVANILAIVMVYLAFSAAMRLIRTLVSFATTVPSPDANCPQCGQHDSFPPPRFGIIGHRQTDRICEHCKLRFAPPIVRTKTIIGLIAGVAFVVTAIVAYNQFTLSDPTSRVFNILLIITAVLGASLFLSHTLDLTRSIAADRNRAS